MKKILYLILTLLLGLCCLTACADDEVSSSSSSSEKQDASNTTTIHITQNDVTLTVGESIQLGATADIEGVYIFWSVRDESIATITDDGLITGVSEGQTICYASYDGQTAMCLVKVVAETAQPLLSVSTPYTDGLSLYVGDSFDPLITVKLGDSVFDGATIEYVVAEKGVVDVVDGKITASGTGSATVSVKVTYGEQTASLSLASRS